MNLKKGYSFLFVLAFLVSQAGRIFNGTVSAAMVS
jgi:hypothetical protein